MIRRFLLSTFLSTLFFGLIANAETISLSPINDGWGTIGKLSGFMVVDGSITIGSSGHVDILLNYNYEAPGAGGPSTVLGPYSDSASLWMRLIYCFRSALTITGYPS